MVRQPANGPSGALTAPFSPSQISFSLLDTLRRVQGHVAVTAPRSLPFESWEGPLFLGSHV
jgi:hypothetical protein